MARARFIRPEFFTDEKVSDLPFGACMLFSGIWCHADLRGVFERNPRVLRGLVFPMRDGIDTATVGKWLGEIESKGMTASFEACGKSWGTVRHWLDHQSIPVREVEIWTKRPAPPGWIDPSAWNAIICKALAAGRIKNDPRTVLEHAAHVPEPIQNTTLTPTPTPTLTPTLTQVSPSSSVAPSPTPPHDDDDPTGFMNDMQAAPEPAHVAQACDRRTFGDWRTMIAHRIFWTREEDEVWKGVFQAEGWDEMTKAYAYLAGKHPAPKKLFLNMFQDLRA